MGSGKTTLGFQLAAKLGWNFTDLDLFIESANGMEITRIFEDLGEKKFREMEHLALKQVLDRTEQVIAIGGGAPCNEENLRSIKEKSISVYLKISVDELVNRLLNSTTPRPLIAGQKNIELKDYVTGLLRIRESFYSQADMVLESDHITVDLLRDFLQAFSVNREP